MDGEESSESHDEEGRLETEAIEEWKEDIGLALILTSVGEVVREGEEGVLREEVEVLLPDLCLSLPSYATTCAHTLHALPSDSSVWGQLEEALINKKFLHHEITSVLYLGQTAALEREVMRVVALYVGAERHNTWWEDERLDISHFTPHGTLLGANPSPGRTQSNVTAPYFLMFLYSQVRVWLKVNLWADSPLVEASGQHTELFTRCLELLGNVLVKTHFSFSATLACSDYLAQVSEEVEGELYECFPSVLSHLAYLLTLPLATHHDQGDLSNPSLLSVVTSGLREELAEGDQGARGKVCVMLCCFPFWLPVLRTCGFLKLYLTDNSWDIFCSCG
ncbi:hypothetical protein GWK47_010984 [Chionoecetes opilio]|uniref:Uncharacterized protein n=1 Tax=Chionoecetes opilio TaxID=41210 RepID=A0A8J5CMG8_CHIOP|nr:hypothetical protein GWK47_010984 [Chionoecetes opilio]